jgi:hypothetical protein
LWHVKICRDAQFRVVAFFKQPWHVVTLEKQPQHKILCKWTVYKFSNLLIKYM